MTFRSILFKRTEDSIHEESVDAPAFFFDLNLAQVIDSVTAGKQEYNLIPFFHTLLTDVDAIHYRHDIFRDLENKTLLENIKSFALKMSTMRRYLALVDKLHYKYHEEGWFLEAVEIYCEAVTRLAHDLNLANLKSKGLLSFREYITDYINSGGFTSLLSETKKLKADLSAIKYCMLIKGNCIKVRKYESEIDYSVEVEKTFEKFKQGSAKDYTAKLPIGLGMNHVEAAVLDLVAKLYPDIFQNLTDYSTRSHSYMDETMAVFDREIQFYVAYLEHVAKLEQTGLQFCYPQISNTCKKVHNYEGFDLALAYKLLNEKSTIVCNDFYLREKERIFVVSGPNQGGKTTFARTFGQLHYLASIGCPVPGRKAQLFLFDKLFTHFEREEEIENLRGKLEDDLVRIHSILNQATSNSIIILNEIFTSTTLQDSIFLSEKIMGKITELDLLCVWVTFIDELATFSEKNVSMVSTVSPENPALRTYKILRRDADGLSYALSIAEKHCLTYDCLKKRRRS